MSRLEDLIHRFLSQKAHLDRAILKTQGREGLVVEVGLGSGRTFDHLREKLPNNKRFAFDFRVETHPGCRPEENEAILGDILKTLPLFAEKHPGEATLVHLDIGTKDRQADKERYSQIKESILTLLGQKALLVSDRPLDSEHLEPLPSLPTDESWSYHSYIHKK